MINQVQIWWLSINTGSLPVFVRGVSFIAMGQAGNTSEQDATWTDKAVTAAVNWEVYRTGLCFMSSSHGFSVMESAHIKGELACGVHHFDCQHMLSGRIEIAFYFF